MTRMKKIITLLLAAILTLSLRSCGKNPSIEMTEPTDAEATVESSLPTADTAPIDATITATEETQPAAFDEATIAQQVTAKHTIFKDENLGNYALVILQNNSAFNLVIGVNATFYGADGAAVGEDGLFQNAVEPGQPAFFALSCATDFEDVSYELTIREETQYPGCLAGLTGEITGASDCSTTLCVTNTGDSPVQLARAYALFFQGEELVYWDWCYIMDDDAQIKPGAKIEAEFYCPADYETVEIYYSGLCEPLE